MESLNTLNVFVQVAEARSFVGAGRVLGVSASAVGKSVARLEERLGVRLFHRSTRSITLTAEGMQFLNRSRRILAEIEAAEDELSQTASAPRGRLKVSMPLVGEPFFTTLAAFREQYPDIELELEFSDRRVDVIEEGYDAVVRSGELPDSNLTSRLLGEYRMMLVASPEYLKTRGMPQHPNELLKHVCVQFRYPNTGKLQVWPLRGHLAQTSLELPVSIVCNNLAARIRFAVQGAGVACLPDFAIREWLDTGVLVNVLPACSEGGVFRLMWPSDKHPAPKLRVFIDFLCENLKLGQ